MSGKRKAEDDGLAPVKKAKTNTVIGDADAAESKTLFVGQLSWNVDNDWLSSEFADAGEVISARVQMDRQSGRSRGFGYVEFATAAAAKSALEKFQGKEIDGRAIKLDLSTPRQPNPAARAKQFGDVASEPSRTLFVGNISWNTTEDILWEHFGQYGEVSSVRIPTDRESGKPKGFGYVEYSDIESAKKGYEGASGSEIDGRNIRLDYSQPRDSSGGGGGGGGRGFGGRGRGSDRGGRVS
jgi:nucleolin